MSAISTDKVASAILIAPPDRTGSPAWVKTKDGKILMSEQAIKDTTVKSVLIKR